LANAGPLVSVVIPCFNQAHFLGEAVESALSQSHDSIETIVVDDGSLDNTGCIARRYPEVRYVRQENRGAAAARNAGLAHSRGQYLLFLDADDRLLAGAAETGLRALGEDRSLAFAVGACRDIGPGGEALGVPDQVLVHRDHYMALLRSCFILSGSSVLFSRWCLERVGGFDESFPAGDDYDLYLRIARRFEIRCHGAVITEYRRHADSLTSDRAVTLRGELAALRAQKPALRGGAERAALKAGRRRARAAHGEALRRQLVARAQAGDRSGALRGAGTLLRRDPAGLARAIANLWADLARSGQTRGGVA
jgi:glycosyltransferase involved in cell wall biosynthesis